MPERRTPFGRFECPKTAVFKDPTVEPAIITATRVRTRIELNCRYLNKKALSRRCMFGAERTRCDIEAAFGIVKERKTVELPVEPKTA